MEIIQSWVWDDNPIYLYSQQDVNDSIVRVFNRNYSPENPLDKALVDVKYMFYGFKYEILPKDDGHYPSNFVMVFTDEHKIYRNRMEKFGDKLHFKLHNIYHTNLSLEYKVNSWGNIVDVNVVISKYYNDTNGIDN